MGVSYYVTYALKSYFRALNKKVKDLISIFTAYSQHLFLISTNMHGTHSSKIWFQWNKIKTSFVHHVGGWLCPGHCRLFSRRIQVWK